MSKSTYQDVLNFNIENKNKTKHKLIENPITIQDKLVYLNIYDIPWSDEYSMPLKSIAADKLLAKTYVNNVLGANIGIPTLHVYNNVNDINWSELPNKFVIKVNHNSGGWIICKDKAILNIQEAINKLNYWMNDDFTFRNGFESHYHWIDRKIIVEPLLEDDKQHDSLYDYKFWCFNGEPKLYTINDGIGHGDIMYYNMDDTENNLYNIQKHENYKKPTNFTTMVEYAKKLSQPFKFVRVDFYEVNDQIYFGELTFTPGNCNFKYSTDEKDIEIGKLLKI